MGDAEYWAERALREARAADQATTDVARLAHHRLAEQLRRKADELRLTAIETGSRPTLGIVTGRSQVEPA